jgi:multisubunit Na+/H+ antiporter MnhC subunit
LSAEGISFFYYGLVSLLAVVGLWGILSQRHVMKKIIAFNLFQAAIILFFLSFVPAKGVGSPASSLNLNPLPLSLALALIAIAFVVSIVLFALAGRLHSQKGIWDEDEMAGGTRE